MGYNVVHKPIGIVTNVLLAYASGKRLHPPILNTIVIHGGQVKREKERSSWNTLRVVFINVINFIL